MIVVDPLPINPMTSWDMPFQRERPFLVMEYISKNHPRKDSETSFEKYEKKLKVPYYLMFHPEHQELTLFRLRGKSYGCVKPNSAGRFRIPKLELEIGLIGDWGRYWFRGELMLITAELEERNERNRVALEAAEAELARLRAEIARLQK